MELDIYCTGGGIKSCMFTLGVMEGLRPNKFNMYSKSGSAWAAYLLRCHETPREALEWALTNMDSRAKVMNWDFRGLWNNSHIFNYDPLIKKFDKLSPIEHPLEFYQTLLYVLRDSSTKYDFTNAHTAIASSSIHGVFPAYETARGYCIDAASKCGHHSRWNQDTSYSIVIDAYGDPQIGGTIISKIYDLIEFPTANQAGMLVDELVMQAGERSVSWLKPPYHLRMGINDFNYKQMKAMAQIGIEKGQELKEMLDRG